MKNISAIGFLPMQATASGIYGKTLAIQTVERSICHTRGWPPALLLNFIAVPSQTSSRILEANFRGRCPRPPFNFLESLLRDQEAWSGKRGMNRALLGRHLAFSARRFRRTRAAPSGGLGTALSARA